MKNEFNFNECRFEMMSESELEKVDGGVIGYILVGGALIITGLVGDHHLEKHTGRDAVEWTGYGMDKAGQALQSWGKALMN